MALQSVRYPSSSHEPLSDDSLGFADADATDEDDEDADLKAMMDKLTEGKGKARNKAIRGAVADEGGKASTRSMMYRDFFAGGPGEREQDGEGDEEEEESDDFEQDIVMADGITGTIFLSTMNIFHVSYVEHRTLSTLRGG